MVALTPVRRNMTGFPDHVRRSCGQVSWIHGPSLPSIPPPTTPCCPVVMFAWSNGRSQSAGVGLRQWLAGSPQHLAESSSSSCGLVVRLRLLFTLPRGNAMTFDYGSEHRSGRNLHPPVSIHSPSHKPPAWLAVEHGTTGYRLLIRTQMFRS